MFKIKGRYRHVSCLDIDIIISNVLSDDKYGVYYWNRHSEYLIDEVMNIVEIKKDNYKNWFLIEENFI